MTAKCVYCGHDAYSVIEVRYARTIKHMSTGVTADDEAPHEVIGRGYYVCDGCLALLDYSVEHHLEPQRHALFNLLSSAYHALVVWGAVAVGSLAGSRTIFVRREFLTLGVMLAFASLVVWFVRANVHSTYFGSWREVRDKPVKPVNSLGGFTNLRDRLNPELKTYLPVGYLDSVKLMAHPASPPLRCLGPNGEPWGQGPQTNFSGRGVNDYYRLVWISWQLWPLTEVLPPEGSDWKAPPPPPITEVEVAVATVFGAGSFAALALAPAAPLWAAMLIGLIAWPIGFVVGKQARHAVEARQEARSSQPVE